MPEIDREIVARALRWCAESGRPVREDEVRTALAPLSWDELLAVKATLADPPPARDLGPDALLALARGGVPPPPPASRPRRAAQAAKAGRAPDAPRIRRARDRVEPPAPGPAALPPVDLLFGESGRAVLERLVRQRGASRAVILQALAAGWTHEGLPPDEGVLARLLAHHGLERGFAERERALVLHTFRKCGGIHARVARDLQTTVDEVQGAVARLGLERQVETVRGERRRVLEARATISERARLLDEKEEDLADLGILPRIEEDLRRRLPGHLRALSAGGRPPTPVDLGRSLSLSRPAVDRLVARLALDLRPAPPGAERGERPVRARRSGPRGAPRPGPPRSGSPRSGPPRSGPPRSGPRTEPRSGPRSGSRPAARPAGRPSKGPRRP